MQASLKKKQASRPVCWNRVSCTIPSHWQTIVTGPQSLIFEDDFIPQFQLRWEKRAGLQKENFDKTSALLLDQISTDLHPEKLPDQLGFLAKKYKFTSCFKSKNDAHLLLILYCNRCEKIIVVQQLHISKRASGNLLRALESLVCHYDRNLFSIQDFSLELSTSFKLKDFTFHAGLSRLSFENKTLELQVCKLGPADRRLASQNLDEILNTLAGVEDLAQRDPDDSNVCHITRSPSIFGQLLVRLKRKKPFICARIRHDESNNRLLSAVLTDTRPIDKTELSTIMNNYEIV